MPKNLIEDYPDIRFLKEIRLKSGLVIPARSLVTSLLFTHSSMMEVNVNQEICPNPIQLKIRRGHEYFGEPFQLPSEEDFARYALDSVCETPLGNETEPDGHDEYGCPSWLLVAGLI